MTAATPAPRYWKVSHDTNGRTHVTAYVSIPASEHTRLLAIEAAYETLKAAARNALDNSWHIDTPHPDCVCHDWRGCTVFDDKDDKELKEALTPAAPGDKGE